MIQTSVIVVYDNMPRFGGAADKNLREGCETFTENVLGEMKVTVPVRTGELRDGLETVSRSDLPSGIYGAIMSRAAHWIFVEFGTRFMVARPFVTPAVHKNLEAFKIDMANQVAKAVVSIAGPSVVG